MTLGAAFARGREAGYEVIHINGASEIERSELLTGLADLWHRELALPGYEFLLTFELDMDPGRFPDLLKAYFDNDWDYDHRYCSHEVNQTDPSLRAGKLTADWQPGLIRRLLIFEDGIRFGASFGLGVVQVPTSELSRALRLSPFNPRSARRLAKCARLAWSVDLHIRQVAFWDAAGGSLSREAARLAYESGAAAPGH